MGKVKYTVAKFVQVMSRGNVVIDSGIDGPLVVGMEEYKKLVAMQEKLAAFDLTSDAVEQAMLDYSGGAAAAMRETDKIVRTRRFDDLIKTTKATVRSLSGLMKTWLEQAGRQQALIDAIKQGIAEKRVVVTGVPIKDIGARLVTRLDDLQSRMVFGDTVDRLPVTIPVLETLKAELAAADIDRYANLAERFGMLNTALRHALSDAQGPVAGLQPSQLGKMMDARLKAIEARRLEVAAPAKDLFDLAFKCQELTDLRQELDRFDAVALQEKVDTYLDLEANALQTVQQDQAALSALPDNPLKPSLQATLNTFQAVIKPIDQLGGPQALDHAIITLRFAEKNYADYRGDLEKAGRYLELLAQLKDALDTKTKEAAALPPSLIRDAMISSIAALAASAKPLSDAKDSRALGEQETAVHRIIATMNGFDLQRYQALAAKYQDAAATWLYHFTAKSKEVAALPDGPVKTTLQGSLDEIDAAFVPLDRIKSPDEIAACTQALAQLQSRVLAVNAAGIAEAITAHQDLVAQVKTQIDDKVKELGATLSPGATKLLRESFLKDYTPLLTFVTVADLAEKTDSLKALGDRVAKHEIKTAVSKESFQKADEGAARTQDRIAKLAPPERQQKAQVALDTLQLKLDQLRVGAVPDGMPREMAVGSVNEGRVEMVSLKSNEHMAALGQAIAALEASLDDPTGTKMLDIEGGDRLAEGLTKMYSTLVAFGANHKGVSPAEALAVQRYTGNDYSAMNMNRRGLNDDERLAFLNKTCDEALAKMPEYPDAAWPAYRAETAWSQDVVDKRYAKGRQFVCGVLWSTGARGTADISRGSPRFVHMIWGKKGRDVAALSANSGEGANQQRDTKFNPAAGRGEVLFPADSSFVVEDRTDPEGAPESIRYSPENSYNIISTKLREVSNG